MFRNQEPCESIQTMQYNTVKSKLNIKTSTLGPSMRVNLIDAPYPMHYAFFSLKCVKRVFLPASFRHETPCPTKMQALYDILTQVSKCGGGLEDKGLRE
jgi:hypothetical protein